MSYNAEFQFLAALPDWVRALFYTRLDLSLSVQRSTIVISCGDDESADAIDLTSVRAAMNTALPSGYSLRILRGQNSPRL
jgi:hypothetical protein